MNTQVTESKNFQERMFEKIKEQMGDLLTSDELKIIVDRAIDEAFFKKTTIRDSWGSIKEEKSSPFVDMVKKEMQESFNVQMKAWLENNNDKVQEAIKESIQGGIYEMMLRHFNNKSSPDLHMLMSNLQGKGLI